MSIEDPKDRKEIQKGFIEEQTPDWLKLEDEKYKIKGKTGGDAANELEDQTHHATRLSNGDVIVK